ncbi:MAG TPA: hypothetical protein VL443_20690 [Cyclobacteriaceae bacterium]|jgi:hypothetical protein|nr:hypothetical protein [Cyclobacteriaceae bacterium]
MKEKFDEKYRELSKTLKEDIHVKIAELAYKQTEGQVQDYSKKSYVVWSQIISTVSIAIVGAVFTFYTNKRSTELIAQQEKDRTSQMATQLMAQRENSETDFRQTMFPQLIKQILDDSLPLKQRVSVFELFENNFNDIFNSRSLYDALWNKAVHNKDEKIKMDLIDLARYISAKQESQINQLEYRKILFCLPGKDTIDYIFDDETNTEKEHVQIHLVSIQENKISITMSIRYNDERGRVININNADQFNVSYFDTPFSSNFMMPDGHRLALILEEIDYTHNPHSARLDIVHFPADYVTVGYRPSIRQVNEIVHD